jgi:hypothetical protein
MELYRLSDDTLLALRARGVDHRADRVIAFMVGCLLEGAETVAQDLGPDRYDDAVSQGVTLWRRGTNRMLRDLRRGFPELAGLRPVEESNALLVCDEEVVVSFFSARNGIDHPDLSGSGRRDRIIDEHQLQLDGMAAEQSVTRLVLLYRRDDDGLVEAGVGVMASARDLVWLVRVYLRGPDDGRPVRRTDEPTSPTAPAYDQQPVPELPPLRRRRREEAQEQSA